MKQQLECGSCASICGITLVESFPAVGEPQDGGVPQIITAVFECSFCHEQFGRDIPLGPPLGTAEEDQHCVECGDHEAPLDHNSLCAVCSLSEREPAQDRLER